MSKCETWEERALGNIFIRKMRFKAAGDIMAGHKHCFDHTTIVFSGSVHISAILPDGTKIDRDVFAPSRDNFPADGEGYVCIKADVEHEITALEDNTEAWCVFAHRDKHGEVISEYHGNTSAYASA